MLSEFLKIVDDRPILRESIEQTMPQRPKLQSGIIVFNLKIDVLTECT